MELVSKLVALLQDIDPNVRKAAAESITQLYKEGQLIGVLLGLIETCL